MLKGKDRGPGWVAAAYAIFGVVWIVVSDTVVFALFEESRDLARIQTGKGWFFVAISSALVYILVRQVRRAQADRQRGAEAATEEREAALRRLDRTLGSISDGVAVVRDRRIVQVNRAFCEIFGYEPEELLGASTDVLHVDEDHFSEFAERSEPALRSGRTFRSTFQMRRKSGEVFPTEHTVTLLDPETGIEGGVVSVVRDISELVQMRREKRERRRDLVHSAEEERRRIALELHDGPGQTLTAARMNLSAALARASGEAEVSAELGQADEMLGATLEGLRSAIDALRPPVLDTLGLLAGIEFLCERFTSRTGIECQFEVTAEGLDIPSAWEIHIFRIVQEALFNIEWHAEATLAEVRLSRRNGAHRMEILDDGRGMEPDRVEAPGRHGISGMLERADLIEGRLVVEPRSGGGTAVRLTFPVGGTDGISF